MPRRHEGWVRAVWVAGALGAFGLPAAARGDDAGAPAAADAKPDPKQICIAASEQGQSERDDGKYRAARTSFVSCAQEQCPRVIAQACTKWLRELDESAPTIVLGAKDEQGVDLTDVRVTLDGQPFVSSLDGNPVEVDTGEHVFRFERDGDVPVEQKILIRAGEKARVLSVVLKPAATTPGGGPPLVATGPEPLASTHHIVSGSLALGAIAAAGVGVAMLLVANHDRSDAQSLRTETGGSPQACSNAATSACDALHAKVTSQYAAQNASTGLFVAAGVLAAGAVASFFAWPWPKHDASAPEATGAVVPLRSGAALQVSGRF